MKKSIKTFIIVVVGFLFLSQLNVMLIYGEQNQQAPSSTSPLQQRSFSHTILGEYGTFHTCQYCHVAHVALDTIYNAHWYPFYYITLNIDIPPGSGNIHAKARFNELGDGGCPSVYFDGGYRVDTGGLSVPICQTMYNASIRACGNRTNVADIDLNLKVTWLGSGTMQIQTKAVNHNTTQYRGRLRVFVTEITSTMGWTDLQGYPFSFPFLDYAENRTITIPAGGSFVNTTTWNGHLYNDGHGHNFGNITMDNTMIIAAIYNATTKRADETTGATPEPPNQQPYSPSNPIPLNNSVNVDITPQLSWTGGDPDQGDSATYDVYFGTLTHMTKVSPNQSAVTYDPGTLQYFTTYEWQIISWDSHGAFTLGPFWSFTTERNLPPNRPYNPIPTNGAINVDCNTGLSWQCTDPEGDSLKYDVFFGTMNPPIEKVSANQTATTYDPGTLAWGKTYYWKIVAWDPYQNKNESATPWSFTTKTDTTQPTVIITKPKAGYLYLSDKEIMKRIIFKNTLIIKAITIEVSASDNDSGIRNVKFSIDGIEKSNDTNAPYTWLWNEPSSSFKTITITVTAYDNTGNSKSVELPVKKIL